jgi:hypothetical protein
VLLPRVPNSWARSWPRRSHSLFEEKTTVLSLYGYGAISEVMSTDTKNVSVRYFCGLRSASAILTVFISRVHACSRIESQRCSSVQATKQKTNQGREEQLAGLRPGSRYSERSAPSNERIYIQSNISPTSLPRCRGRGTNSAPL